MRTRRARRPGDPAPVLPAIALGSAAGPARLAARLARRTRPGRRRQRRRRRHGRDARRRAAAAPHYCRLRRWSPMPGSSRGRWPIVETAGDVPAGTTGSAWTRTWWPRRRADPGVEDPNEVARAALALGRQGRPRGSGGRRNCRPEALPPEAVGSQALSPPSPRGSTGAPLARQGAVRPRRPRGRRGGPGDTPAEAPRPCLGRCARAAPRSPSSSSSTPAVAVGSAGGGSQLRRRRGGAFAVRRRRPQGASAAEPAARCCPPSARRRRGADWRRAAAAAADVAWSRAPRTAKGRSATQRDCQIDLAAAGRFAHGPGSPPPALHGEGRSRGRAWHERWSA